MILESLYVPLVRCKPSTALTEISLLRYHFLLHPPYHALTVRKGAHVDVIAVFAFGVTHCKTFIPGHREYRIVLDSFDCGHKNHAF